MKTKTFKTKIRRIIMHAYNLTLRKLPTKLLIFIVCICGFMFFGSNLYKINTSRPYSEMDHDHIGFRVHIRTVEDFFASRMTWSTSVLGGILFKREEIPQPNPNANRTYTVLVWKYWKWLKNRHVYNFAKAGLGKVIQSHVPGVQEDSYLEGCSVQNCVFSGNEEIMQTADAVLVHLQRGIIPNKVENRNPKQRWIFLNDESPKNAFSLAKKRPSLESFYNVFNWSMTYRSDADVPVPYGRTLPLDGNIMTNLDSMEVAALVPNWTKKRRDRPATVLMSNCGVKARNDFLTELRKHIAVDIYGKCSDKEEFKTSCPGHFREDCETVEKYIFYLVLENASCRQYLTEKLFYHAYSKGAIPVIWGPSIDDVESLLPPNSYVYADKDTDLEKLAENMLAIAENDEILLSMHMWRNNFEVVNEHGYFGSKSYHLCRLCEALNYNDEKEKIYGKEDIDRFFDPLQSCAQA